MIDTIEKAANETLSTSARNAIEILEQEITIKNNAYGIYGRISTTRMMSIQNSVRVIMSQSANVVEAAKNALHLNEVFEL
ncbi:hypothetical protein [Vibrio phage XZ1]|uniref:Uncharacterized protein n=1 Tax=Vibrio phage ValKK3 TaxID=1610855 RepID=A0A0D4DB77_9CAUD|nr:hypothetical protein AVU32_gp091 [Vibrio phage ValKK3]AJT60932.1 hypothetical protein [Vibrio phage ValKK3]UOL51358.1 hypothetical protein [Vibrio phage XZ1]